MASLARRSALAFLAAIGSLGVAPVSEASLTSSETAQIVSFVQDGSPSSVARVRALVARPDLTADESAAVLGQGLRAVTFDDAHAAWVKELVFGGSSATSRPVLAVAATRALVARADALIAKHEGDLDRDPRSMAELVKIFGFLDAEIANAGKLAAGSRAHDPQIGIPTSSYDECVHAMSELVDRHPKWLRGDAVLSSPPPATPRAQLQIALLDMMNDTPTRVVDAADELSLAGPRRALFIEGGVVLVDDGHMAPPRVDAIREMLARAPAAKGRLEAVAPNGVDATLAARGHVLAVDSGPPMRLFPDEVAAVDVDASLAKVARGLGWISAKRALDSRPELRAQLEVDARAAGGDAQKALGAPRDATPEATLAAAITLLLVDAPRTIDLAMVRLLAGHAESLAILSDAVGAVASFAPPPSGKEGVSTSLGRARADGTTESVRATGVVLAHAGYATAFTVLGHAWAISRDDAGHLGATRDGAKVSLASLTSARTPVSAGTLWQGGGLVFAKLAGSPRAGVAPGPRVRLVGAGAGLDAIATPAPGDDVAVEGEVTASGTGEAALVLRAVAVQAGMKGVAIVFAGGRVSVRAIDDAGKSTELAAPVDLPSSAPWHVRAVVKGAQLDATVAGVKISAAIPPALAHGDVAFAARAGAEFEIATFTVKKP